MILRCIARAVASVPSTRRAALCAAALVAPVNAIAAQLAPRDTTSVRQIAPGVVLTRIARTDGPLVMHVLALDLRQRDLAIRAARACDRLTGRERPSAIARRLRAEGLDVVAVLNAGFFDLEGGTGSSESSVVIDGELVKGVKRTESPFDRFDNVHSQFGVTANGRPLIERFRLTGTVRTARGSWPLATVNGTPAGDEMALYTEWSDRPPRFPTMERSAAVPVARVSGRGDTVGYRVSTMAAPSRGDRDAAPAGRSLLVGSGRAAAEVARLREGERVRVVHSFTPIGSSLATLVGGWPRILRGGVNVALTADSAEGTSPGFSARRHPRSAVGMSRDSSTLFLVAVDGRQPSSVGMSLDELAGAMLALGAYDALNLDGGGSTALVVGDSVASSPSDSTGERPVGDAIVITRQPPGAAGYRLRTKPATERVASCITSGTRDPDRLPAKSPR